MAPDEKRYGKPQNKGSRPRGTGPHRMSEGDSIPISLRIPSSMARQIDSIISRSNDKYLSRADFVRDAIERLAETLKTVSG